jgi:hypothetical protein
LKGSTMTQTEDIFLIDAPLVPDPDASEEMGPGDAEAIADEDIKGCRLLLVRRAVEPVDLEGTPGGAIELACTFQPAAGARFKSARLVLRLTEPPGVLIADIAPRNAPEKEPVKFALDTKGKLSLKYLGLEAGAEAGTRKEYAVYHCAVLGSGEATPTARWDFAENPHKKDGLGHEHALALTLPIMGMVSGTVSVAARLARLGLPGKLEAIRDLILGPRLSERRYPITFDIPKAQPASGLFRFLRLA